MNSDIGNEQLQELASRHGTPLYVYNADTITGQYQRLKEAFSGCDVRFFYAAKALTNIHVLTHIRDIGCNIDCSSVNEVHLALKAGFPSEKILYTSNSIDFSEIQEAKQQGVHINIDSVSNLMKFAQAYGSSYPVGIRIRPNIMAGGNLKIATGHDASKFGISLEELPGVAESIKENGLKIRTLHIHTGSEIKDVAVFSKGIELLYSLVHLFPDAEVLDLGGGFKVPYKPGETGTDISALAESVTRLQAQFESKTGRHFQFWFEPGKFMVSECGHFIVRVNVIKSTGTITFAGVDSGFNHLIRPMFYGAYHRIDNISNTGGVQKPYHVVGNICETDTFAEGREIPFIREGDLLAIRNAGAYCFEMASNYNSRFLPAEVLVKEGQSRLIRRRETLEDLLRTQIEI